MAENGSNYYFSKLHQHYHVCTAFYHIGLLISDQLTSMHYFCACCR